MAAACEKPYYCAMPRRFLACCASILVFVAAPRAAAQLVTIVANGTLEHLVNPERAPRFVPGEIRVSFSLRLDESPDPDRSGPESAVYAPFSARFEIGGETFSLPRAEFVVERYGDAMLPWAGYLLRGWTEAGRFIAVANASTSPGYAPDFSIPQALPSDELDVAHDVTLSDTAEGWAAYGDATFTSIEVTPAPETEAMGAVVGVLLCAAAFHRRWRRRSLAGAALAQGDSSHP